jgi:hypothetical protein
MTPGLHMISDNDSVIMGVMNKKKKTWTYDWEGCQISFVWQNLGPIQVLCGKI